MIDIKVLRNEPEKVQRAFLKRREKFDVEGVLELDDKRKEPSTRQNNLKISKTPFPNKFLCLKKRAKTLLQFLQK